MILLDPETPTANLQRLLLSLAAPLVLTLPWILPLVVAVVRWRRSASLDDYRLEVHDAPLVSVIVPARNERRNIARVLRSLRASQYPRFEILIVDDHSTDGTGDLARAIAAESTSPMDVRVLPAPALPDGWFGKQWACATGASQARGDLLLFTDADTYHAPDLLPRAVNALQLRHVDLLTLSGHQEMGSFWERVVQPQLFATIALRFGGTETVSHARNPADVIANGQFILVRRDAYVAMDGHHRVRHQVAEDLMMAQAWVRAGRRMALLLAMHQFSTRMYTSLAEVVTGWRKNIFAGGRFAMRGAVGRLLFPLVLVAVPLFNLFPIVGLAFGLAGHPAWLLWGVIVVAVNLVYWGMLYKFMQYHPLNAVLYPLGMLVFFYIAVGAVLRGQRVRWKEREYTAAK